MFISTPLILASSVCKHADSPITCQLSGPLTGCVPQTHAEPLASLLNDRYVVCSVVPIDRLAVTNLLLRREQRILGWVD